MFIFLCVTKTSKENAWGDRKKITECSKQSSWQQSRKQGIEFET